MPAPFGKWLPLGYKAISPNLRVTRLQDTANGDSPSNRFAGNIFS